MLMKELTKNITVLLFSHLPPLLISIRFASLPTAHSHCVSFDGEIIDSEYNRITAEIASLEIHIRHQLSKPLRSGMGSMVESFGYDSHLYKSATRLIPQLPDAGEDFAGYLDVAKQPLLQPSRILHHDPRVLTTLDNQTHLAPRETHSRLLFAVEPNTPDRQIVVSAAEALPLHIRSLYRDWYEELDLPPLTFSLGDIQREAERIKNEEQLP